MRRAFPKGGENLIRIFWTTVDRVNPEAVYGRCSSARRNKADGCLRREDRVRSLAATAMLEKALASVGLREADVFYGSGEGGKPLLLEYPDLHFSLSHSGSYAVCVIADRPVGVDVETQRNISKALRRRYFSEEEQAADPVRVWVLKESFCKMTGRGLAQLGEIRLTLGASVSAAGHSASFWEKELPGGARLAVCAAGNQPVRPEVFE